PGWDRSDGRRRLKPKSLPARSPMRWRRYADCACVEGERRRSPSHLEIVDDRVGDGPLGDDADHVVRSRPAGPMKDDGGAGTMALQARKHQTQEVGVPADDRTRFDETVDRRVRIVSGFPPEAGARRNEAGDSPVPFDHDRARVVLAFGAENLVQRGPGLGEKELALHDVLRLLHQVEIDMALLRDAVAPVA